MILPAVAAGAPLSSTITLLYLNYDEFLSRVQRRAGLDREVAELVAQATLTTLAVRITRGEAEDLAVQLPVELRPWLQLTGSEAERFSTREFIRRVAQGVPVLDRQEAEDAVAAVLVTLREAVSEKEVSDLFSQLPDDMLRLFSLRATGSRG